MQSVYSTKPADWATANTFIFILTITTLHTLLSKVECMYKEYFKEILKGFHRFFYLTLQYCVYSDLDKTEMLMNLKYRLRSK